MFARLLRASLGLSLALACCAGLGAAATPKAPKGPATPSPKPAAAAPALPTMPAPSRAYLADTVSLAHVGDRITRVSDFIRGWQNAWAPDMPPPDSAGRVEFLNTIVSKELMALEAARLQIPLAFEDRLELREYQQRLLANVLFRRAIAESVFITNEEVEAHVPEFKFAVHARHILFADDATAERVRADLVAKRITWAEAAQRYSRDDSTRSIGGDMGWILRGNASPVIAMDIWPLAPGVVSPVFHDDDGPHVAQVIERRPGPAIDPKSTRALIRSGLLQYRTAKRLGALQSQVRQRIHLVYDEAAIEWASRYFSATYEYGQGAHGGTELQFNDVMPDFQSSDTARVLARSDQGTLTLGRFLNLYSHISVMARPTVNTPGLFQRAINLFLLEPAMADEALARGLDNDAVVIRNLGIKREQLLVEHLYQDSVGTHAWAQPDERRKFYEAHLTAYFTFPKVEYAIFAYHPERKAAAETLATHLRAGEDASHILADSLYGFRSGSIQTRRQNEETVFKKLLFEELRPGDITVEGPGKDGTWFVIQMRSYDPGRQLSYEEAAQYVDDDIQKIRGEELLAAFVERLKQRYPWWSRPELVMGIDLEEKFY